jgi:hypothetical protein
MLEKIVKDLLTSEELAQYEQNRNTITVSTLILELTRRCNMNCQHCLRGDAQDIDMSRRTIGKAINMASAISSVTFTGGEPTLRLDLIEFTYELLLEKFGHGNLPAFFIATNGRCDQLQLSSILLKWYADTIEPEMCSVCISEDVFHGSFDDPNYLSGLAFYSDTDKKHDLSEMEDEATWVLREGRGAYLPINSSTNIRTPSENGLLEVYNAPKGYSLGQLYVSAKEEISGECDYSYESMDEQHLCMLDGLLDYLQTAPKQED